MLRSDQAKKIAESLVERGIAAGATAADALYVGDRSSSVQVRLGEIDSLGASEGEQIGLRLFVGQRSATVASSDLSDEVVDPIADARVPELAEVRQILANLGVGEAEAFAELFAGELGLEVGERALPLGRDLAAQREIGTERDDPRESRGMSQPCMQRKCAAL